MEQHSEHTEHTEHNQHVTPRTYYLVFAALMVLLVLTMMASGLGTGLLGISVALTIAVVKAVLIILYFMHVRYSERLIWLFSGAAFFWLGIMLGFVFTDYLSRPFLDIPGR